jgi:uncharacterized protein (DUF302 family)
MTEPLEDYAFNVHLDRPRDEAIEAVTAALKDEGFGVLTAIDVQATLKQKLDQDFRPYTILGACNPRLAHRALSRDLRIGLLLPCNVIVYEDDDGLGSTVSVVDPLGMLGPIDQAELQEIADEAHARLSRVAQALAGRARLEPSAPRLDELR